jgi:hypothetical protein
MKSPRGPAPLGRGRRHRVDGVADAGHPTRRHGVRVRGRQPLRGAAVQNGHFVWGRICTELMRDAGGIDAQIERMTKG